MNVSQRTRLTAAEIMLPFSAGVWQHGFESQSRYIALRIRAGENHSCHSWCSVAAFHLSKSQEKNQIQNGGAKDIGFSFRRVRQAWKNVAAQEKCSAALSTEIASIGLCQPQSNPQPKGVWTSLRDSPCLPRRKEFKTGGLRKMSKEKSEKDVRNVPITVRLNEEEHQN